MTGSPRNGSFVNGDRVVGRRALRDGDRLIFGETPLIFRSPADAGASSTIGVTTSPAAVHLTPTQKQILVALCRPVRDSAFATPLTNKEIAEEVTLSVDAVKAHLRTLFERFGLEDLPQNQLALKNKLREELDGDRPVNVALEGLREWYLACLDAGPDAMLGMPSRAVDVAWHEMILMTRSYHHFCERAFGYYLHHSPEAVMDEPMRDGLARTLAAVERNRALTMAGVPLLFAIDSELDVAGGQTWQESDIAALRDHQRQLGHGAGWHGGGCAATGSGCGGGGCGGGGCGGGGCGGGGCGGGGCGGGG